MQRPCGKASQGQQTGLTGNSFFAAILMSKLEWEDEEGRFLLLSLTLIPALYPFSVPLCPYHLDYWHTSFRAGLLLSSPVNLVQVQVSTGSHCLDQREKDKLWSPCLPGSPPSSQYPFSSHPSGFLSQQLLPQALNPANHWSLLRL